MLRTSSAGGSLQMVNCLFLPFLHLTNTRPATYKLLVFNVSPPAQSVDSVLSLREDEFGNVFQNIISTFLSFAVMLLKT